MKIYFRNCKNVQSFCRFHSFQNLIIITNEKLKYSFIVKFSLNGYTKTPEIYCSADLKRERTDEKSKRGVNSFANKFEMNFCNLKYFSD